MEHDGQPYFQTNHDNSTQCCNSNFQASPCTAFFFESTSLQHQETLNEIRPVKKLPTDMPVPLGLQL